jgi:hypothetical protein
MTIVTNDNTATPPDAGTRRARAGQARRGKRDDWHDGNAHGAQDPPAAAGLRAADDPDTAVEQALAAAAADETRIGDVLDALRRGRLWLPLPDDGTPVTDGSAVTLPTVVYLGREFVPAYTSASQLIRASGAPDAAGSATAARRGGGAGDAPSAPLTGQAGLAGGEEPQDIPHLVVPAAALARLLPAGLGIALNPGAPCSVPVYPEGVAYLAAAQVPAARMAPDRSAPGRRGGGRPGRGQHPSPGARAPAARRTARPPLRVGAPPSEPAVLLARIRAGLANLPAASEAAIAWLDVADEGSGLVVAVTLDDPASGADQDAVLAVVQRAAAGSPDAEFPIDVTFPGEAEPDEIDRWVAESATPFYRRD